MDILTQGTNALSTAGIPELDSYNRKKTLYQHPGRVVDALYYDKDSSAVYPIENQTEAGKYYQSIQGANYGGRYDITLPNMNFLERAVLTIELDRPTLNLAQASLPRGWGNRLVGDVTLMMPSADMPSLTLENISFVHSQYCIAQSTDQLTYYNRSAGECLVNTDFSEAINYTPQDLSVGKIVANVVLDLPWSNIGSGEWFLKKGFDSTLLNNPVRIAFQFNPASAIWGSYPNPPAFTATLFYRDQNLVNKALSLRNTLFREPGQRITYPSVWRQLQSVYFTANKPVASQYSINLTQFIASDLLSLAISVHRVKDLNPTTANTPANPLNCVDLVNPKLQFGGETLYYAPGNSYKILNSASTLSGVEWDTPITLWNGSAMAVAGQRSASPVIIDFSAIRAICNGKDFPNTVKYDSQTLNLTFNLAQAIHYLNVGGVPANISLVGEEMVCMVTAFYPQVTSVLSGGAVAVAFN